MQTSASFIDRSNGWDCNGISRCWDFSHAFIIAMQNRTIWPTYRVLLAMRERLLSATGHCVHSDVYSIRSKAAPPMLDTRFERIEYRNEFFNDDRDDLCRRARRTHAAIDRYASKTAT